MERTLVILKPDAVERGLVGEILRRFEKRGLVLAALELRRIDEDLANRHYAEHAGKPFFDGLVEFITRGPSVVAIIEGPPNTYRIVRELMGATDPGVAAAGTIRADLAIELPENLIHGSDSVESAHREIDLFFPGFRSA